MNIERTGEKLKSEKQPGAAFVSRGLQDIAGERRTLAACLVSIASPRLRRAGLLPAAAVLVREPERELYRLLCAEGGDAYSRYNSLLRELVSFENALDRRQNKKLKAES